MHQIFRRVEIYFITILSLLQLNYKIIHSDNEILLMSLYSLINEIFELILEDMTI
jgi:hypothetical protein